MLMEERIQKILSRMGIVSRRKAEELILEGRVTVNGKAVAIGMKADTARDYIKVDGKLIAGPTQKKPQNVYLMFNKPRGIVTTLSDPEKRPTVKDFLKNVKYRVFPVGRLDFDSEGLLLLTNDGDFANAVMHPSQRMSKTYLVKVKGIPGEEEIGKLRRGVKLEDGRTQPARVRKIKELANNSWIEITIYEGRKRQVRRMLEKIGHEVIRLQRIAIDGLKLGGLRPGEIRHLTDEELKTLKKEIEIEKQPEIRSRQVTVRQNKDGRQSAVRSQ